MNRSEALTYLITELGRENQAYQNLAIPVDDDEKRSLLRALMNVRESGPISSALLAVQDQLLQQEVQAKGIVTLSEIETVNQWRARIGGPAGPFGDKLSLWQGDITRLAVDAIVNAANSQLLGCFVPGHNCIDNVIHSAAGLQLRVACYQQMKQQHAPEPTGQA